VLKRISKPTITKDGLQVVNILPRRIKPLESEQSIWQAIDRYWQKPIGNRKPEKDEEPTAFELSILDGILTEDQKEVWHANLEASKIQDKLAEDELIIEKVKEMNGQSLQDVIKAIEEEFNRKLSPMEVLEIQKR
jgi:hypothetical protein